MILQKMCGFGSTEMKSAFKTVASLPPLRIPIRKGEWVDAQLALHRRINRPKYLLQQDPRFSYSVIAFPSLAWKVI